MGGRGGLSCCHLKHTLGDVQPQADGMKGQPGPHLALSKHGGGAFCNDRFFMSPQLEWIFVWGLQASSSPFRCMKHYTCPNPPPPESQSDLIKEFPPFSIFPRVETKILQAIGCHNLELCPALSLFSVPPVDVWVFSLAHQPPPPPPPPAVFGLPCIISRYYVYHTTWYSPKCSAQLLRKLPL